MQIDSNNFYLDVFILWNWSWVLILPSASENNALFKTQYKIAFPNSTSKKIREYEFCFVLGILSIDEVEKNVTRSHPKHDNTFAR